MEWLSRFRTWRRERRDRRRWRDEVVVTAALRERPDQTGGQLVKRTGLSFNRLFGTLARLEHREGRITSRWADEPPPRRRLYRLDGDA